MTANMKLFISFFTLFLLLLACSGDEPESSSEPKDFRELDFESEVSFTRSNGEIVSTIKAAVADDDNSRSQGLMDVHDLPSDSGMLFIFEDEQARSFWMANTPLSLDIIYVNEDYEIVRIHQNTAPYSNQSIQSEVPAKYVVEVNAGYTLRNDIVEGMSIQLNTE